jgi:uncharacterized protein YbjT (DUF2867 family)
MRILITGGFGYIGAKLAAYLFQNGHHVVLGSQRVLTSPNWLPQTEVVNTIWEDEKALTKICQGVDAFSSSQIVFTTSVWGNQFGEVNTL